MPASKDINSKEMEARRPGVKGHQSEALSVRCCSYLREGLDHLETGQGQVRVIQATVFTLSERGFPMG